jgi:hypothetical protein
MRQPLTRTPFTYRDKTLIHALSPDRVTYQPGSSAKRFARTLNHDLKHRETLGMTDRQRAYMAGLAWTYRRQIAEELVPVGSSSIEEIEFFSAFHDELADFRHLEHDDDDLGEIVSTDQLELL